MIRRVRVRTCARASLDGAKWRNDRYVARVRPKETIRCRHLGANARNRRVSVIFRKKWTLERLHSHFLRVMNCFKMQLFGCHSSYTVHLCDCRVEDTRSVTYHLKFIQDESVQVLPLVTLSPECGVLVLASLSSTQRRRAGDVIADPDHF